jgi:hypothetical protein
LHVRAMEVALAAALVPALKTALAAPPCAQTPSLAQLMAPEQQIWCTLVAAMPAVSSASKPEATVAASLQ